MILDHELEISLDDASVEITVVNMHALEYLRVGMLSLAQQVRAREVALGKKLPRGSAIFFPGFADTPFLASCFCWFGVTVVSYLRLVKLVGLLVENRWDSRAVLENRNKVSRECREYVKGIIPDVLKWRNTVAAHLAITDPKHWNNVATLEASLLQPVDYRSPYLWAGAYSWGTEGESSEMMPWALTQTFEELAPRFWPGQRLQEIPPYDPSALVGG